MNTKSTPLRKEKGVVLVLVALSLVVLMGMAGLAIDLSHAEVNKTRLQNLADAMALSAAISLNKEESSATIPDREAFAENYARTNTLSTFTASTNNQEVDNAISISDLAFEFRFSTTLSSTASDWKLSTDTSINNAIFARVEATNPMNVPTWFAGIMGFNNVAVSVSAVAGTAPIIPCNNVLPMMMCADASDTNCDDNSRTGFGNTNNDCFGYEKDVVYAAKESKWQSDSIGPGNFGYFDVGDGKADIKSCLAGDPSCAAGLCALIGSATGIVSEPGSAVGPGEQGLNTRFDDYKGSIKYSACTANYPNYCPDSLVNNSLGVTLSSTARTVNDEFNPANGYTVPPSANPSAQIYNYYYKGNYSTTSGDLGNTHSFSPGRRLVTLPFVSCTADGTGKTPMPTVGFGCWFLTSASDGKTIYAEFLGTDGCDVSGTPTAVNNFGFYKVQLYKDPFGGHS